eukprot:364407-Chlamydomonas_euryale.AAC.11
MRKTNEEECARRMCKAVRVPAQQALPNRGVVKRIWASNGMTQVKAPPLLLVSWPRYKCFSRFTAVWLSSGNSAQISMYITRPYARRGCGRVVPPPTAIAAKAR